MPMLRLLARWIAVAVVLGANGLLVAQSYFPDDHLDPARALNASASSVHSSVPEQYIWTEGDVTALRADRANYSWSKQSLRVGPHFFRAHFHLDRIPSEATLYLAGPRLAEVYLNGQKLGRFSSNIDAPISFHVFHANATKFLKRGENTIAIMAVRGRGIVSSGTADTAQLAYGEVLAVKLLPSAFGSEGQPLLVSNRTWRSTAANTDHWTEIGFDDRPWAPVQSLGSIEGNINFYQWSADAGMYGWPGYRGMSDYLRTYDLYAEKLLHVFEGQGGFVGLDSLTSPGATESPRSQFRVAIPDQSETDADAPTLMLDFGREVNGRIVLESACACIARVSVAYGESEIEAMATSIAPGAQGGNFLGTNTLEVPAHGSARGPKSAFRFVRVTFLKGAPVTEFRSLRLEGIAYPVRYLGSFKSSDPLLNRIWETGAHTAHLCMQDGVWDGPKRDRGRWSGDIDISGRTISDVFGDTMLLEDTLRHLTPADEGPKPHNHGIPSYAALWLSTLYDLNLHSGDRPFLEAEHKSILRVLAGMDADLDPSGIFINPNHAWLFVDWSPGQNAYGRDPLIGTQLQYIRGFKMGSSMLSELGDAENARKYGAEADRLSVAAIAKYRDTATETFGSTVHLNTLALLALPQQPSGSVWDRVLSHVQQKNPMDEVISPYFNAYVLDAMAQIGHRQTALDWIRTYWGGMLAEGATSFWESYDLRWQKMNPHLGLQADQTSGYFISLAHGWSSGPTAWLERQVLGISPTSAGFRTVTIRPDLMDLVWAKGSMPTPNGQIEVSMGRDKPTEIDLPQGEDATVLISLPPSMTVVELNGLPVAFVRTESGNRAEFHLIAAGHFSISSR